ncbi:MAG: T6SS effector amidase Tae4 family protein [Chitinophagaceae bacterium]
MDYINMEYLILEQNHPLFNAPEVEKPYKKGQVGKMIDDNNYNTCCAQISTALNKSGIPIEDYRNFVNPEVKGNIIRAYSDKPVPVKKNDKNTMNDDVDDKNYKNYILSPLDLRQYLNQKYFLGEHYKNVVHESTRKNRKGEEKIFLGGSVPKEIMGRKGIVVFGNEHADLWNGAFFHQRDAFGYSATYSWWDPFGHTYAAGGNGVYFWEVMTLAEWIAKVQPKSWIDLFDWTSSPRLRQQYIDNDALGDLYK